MSPAHSRNFPLSALPKGAYIRYLLLEPGSNQDPLVCQLLVTHIDAAPPFEALSYPWGHPEKVAQLDCLGRQALGITASLEELLRRVRLTQGLRSLWADQICIDQISHREKEHQVGLMGRIYRKATRVLIWLGGDFERGRNAASLITEVNGKIDKQLPESGSRDELPNANPDDPFFRDRRWKSLDAAFKSPWFTRVWVTQEVALACDPWVLYGKSEFDWTSLMRVSQWTLDFASFLLDSTSIPLQSIHTATLDGWAVDKSDKQTKRDFGTFSKDWTLLKLLNSAKGLKATDPRDFIYSFLGHPAALRSSDMTIIAPDYSIDHLETFHKFGTQWLSEPLASTLLLAVEHNVNSLEEDFPSWVPR